jgi:imidazoleglycerol-phosphate dehydratase
MVARKSKILRETGETKISLELNLDGNGSNEINTGSGMFDHLIAQISRHGLIDIKLDVEGDTEVGWHHTIEDTAIVLGKAINEAIGEGKGIVRMGHSFVPLDECLALVAIDFSGRGYSVIKSTITSADLGQLSGGLIEHFLETLAREGKFNMHITMLSGSNNHHKAESIFKGLARAIRQAASIDTRSKAEPTSTKGTIS